MGNNNQFAAVYDGVYLVNGARTPFGKFCGTLGSISPTDLGIIASREALNRSGLAPENIQHVVFANIIQASVDAIYLPRHIAQYCAIPFDIPALLVQRICGSGFESIIAGTEQIVLGKAQAVLAGGAENMTLVPTSSFGNRLGYRLGQPPKFEDMLMQGLYDPAAGCSMGQTAENLAKKYSLTREETDAFALRSATLASAAKDNGILAEEIVPVATGKLERDGMPPRAFRTTPKKAALDFDEHIRATDTGQLASLKPSFAADGVQTAGNSSGIVDGAAAVVVASQATVDSKGLAPLARIAASSSAGVDPSIMGIGPAPAIRLLLEKTGLKQVDIDLFEINEAFGAQIVAVEKELGLDRDKLNVNGGAIAIGHPLAATGTRLTHTLALEMRRRGVRYGIASACIGGGQGTAILLENQA